MPITTIFLCSRPLNPFFYICMKKKGGDCELLVDGYFGSAMSNIILKLMYDVEKDQVRNDGKTTRSIEGATVVSYDLGYCPGAPTW